MRINQFHSGTAPGDAITNEMLALRDMLVAAGYESRIFAEHVAPELSDQVRPVAQYDGRADSVLLVHHSMGFDCFDHITALPDRKILVYHNITPAEYFEHNPFLGAYAQKGKAQLSGYQPHVQFAFADSEFNRQELSDLGFTRTDTLPVTFGLNALLRTPPNQNVLCQLADTVNLLFVGRIVANKRQDDLVRMFAYYRRHIDPTARLILVGSFDQNDGFYSGLRQLAIKHGLDASVLMPGKVTDAELAAYYRSASAFISTSEHEGFGVPLVESMMFGVPVVAYGATAVPYTLGQAGLVFQHKDIRLLAELVGEVVHNHVLREAMLEVQDQRLETLRPDQFLHRLTSVAHDITRNGHTPPNETRRSIQIQGPFETSYSLAITNRGLARALARIDGVDVSLFATEGPGDYTPRAEDLADKPDVELLWRKSLACQRADVVIRNMYPPRVDDVDPRQINLSYFYWEDSLVPAEWSDNFNRYLDMMLVPTRHVRTVLRRSGVGIPIAIVGAGVDAPNDTAVPLTQSVFATGKSFRFLHISSGFPRKGCDVLLRAYTSEFSAADDVSLIIKTFPNPHNSVAAQIEEARRRTPDCPEIIHLDDDLPANAIAALYRDASCLVHPARAEGFGLPAAEAMLARIPVIATNYSGLADFCMESTAALLDYVLAPSGSHFGVDSAEWAEPDEGQLRQHMRYVVEHASSADILEQIDNAHDTIRRDFSWEKVASRTLSTIESFQESAVPMRAGLVTTWSTRCGIAEYARQLVDASPPGAVQWTILAADEEPLETDGDNVVRCWRDRWHGDLFRVLEEVGRRGLDVVHFQFNFGFFELMDLGRAIRALKADGRAVFVTLHATKDTLIGDELVSLSAIADDLGSLDRIFVHTPEDWRRLAGWQVQDNVTRLPHAFLSFPDQDRAAVRRRLGLVASPIVSTFGFALPHKGLLESIDALKLLLDSYPDMLLLALTSLHSDSRSKEYYARCRERITGLGLDRNCSIVTEFLKPDEIVTGLQASDLVILPYHESSESSSAAVRLPLASHRPVVTTRQSVFSDVEDIVYQIPSPTPCDIAQGVSEILSQRSLCDEVVKRADTRIARDSWASIAQIELKIMRGGGAACRTING